MKKVTDLSSSDLKKLRGESSKGMRMGEWRLMPMMCDDHKLVTAWAIFELDPGASKGSGDIRDVTEGAWDLPYWAGIDIVRAHNKALGFYKGE